MLHWWAINLSAYNYTVKCQLLDKHGNADALSQLPLESDNCWIDNFDDTVCLLEQQLTQLPIKAVDIQCEISSDPVCQKFTILLFMGGLFQQAQCLRSLNHFTRSVLTSPHLMVA